MKIQITLEVHDEAADPEDDTGLTLEAFDAVFDGLSSVGDDINIRKVDE